MSASKISSVNTTGSDVGIAVGAGVFVAGTGVFVKGIADGDSGSDVGDTSSTNGWLINWQAKDKINIPIKRRIKCFFIKTSLVALVFVSGSSVAGKRQAIY